MGTPKEHHENGFLQSGYKLSQIEKKYLFMRKLLTIQINNFVSYKFGKKTNISNVNNVLLIEKQIDRYKFHFSHWIGDQ